VSFELTVMETHPAGMTQEVGWARVVVESGVGVSVEISTNWVGEGSGEANSTAKVVGMGEGVGGNDGEEVSARDNEIPPMTSKREIAPMMNPLPICRRAFMINSPCLSYLCRSAAAR
jgi:hypothetical protein